MLTRSLAATAMMLGSPVRPNPEPRAPLPPFPPGSYDRVLTQTVPPAPDLRWWRMNFSSVVVPGLPFVPGGSSEHPERCLTGFLNKWTEDVQDRILDTHARRGYTHFLLWWPDSRESGQSIAEYVAMAGRVKAAGFYVVHSLTSKAFDPRDADWDYYQPRLTPLLSALLDTGAIDHALIGMELDLFNVPGFQLQGIINGVTDLLVPHGVRCYVHFSPEKTWWGRPGEYPDRVAWWNAQQGRLTGLCYQCDPNWPVPLAQAHIVDTLTQFGNTDSGFGHPFDFVTMENLASVQFSQDHPDEDDGDLFGYLLLCTQGAVPVMGGGNGFRAPDGSVI